MRAPQQSILPRSANLIPCLQQMPVDGAVPSVKFYSPARWAARSDQSKATEPLVPDGCLIETIVCVPLASGHGSIEIASWRTVGASGGIIFHPVVACR